MGGGSMFGLRDILIARWNLGNLLRKTPLQLVAATRTSADLCGVVDFKD